ncbi:MAG: hypothetical protein GZ087_10835, partial [Flavobacterium sp.]|nr:hypothetical protein [Flavobacterium sp.]
MEQNYFYSEKAPLALKLSKTIRLLLIALFLVVVNATVKAQNSDIYESYAILSVNGGVNVYYDLQASTGNPDFQGVNLGTFYSGNTLILNGGQNKVYVCPIDDITSGNLYYRIYKILDTPPSFTNSIQFLDPVVDYPGAACSGAGKNQDWESKTAGINVLSSLTPGTYYLEVYTNADYKVSNVQQGIPHYANNGTLNYKAQFTVAANCVTGVSVIPITVVSVCVGDTAATLNATITTASGSGAANITYEWFSNTSNSTTGGVSVQGPITTTTATSISSYTPLTGAAGTLWYYCTVTNTDATCSGSYSTTPVEVVVNTPSIAPTSITGITTICSGDSTTLTLSGGSAGTGAMEEWFTGSCGGTSAGTATNSITVSPIATTTYYVRYSGSCNTTACASVTVTVEPTVGTPTTITISAGTDPSCQLTNGTTTTTYATTATNNTGFNWSLSNGAAGSIGATTGIMTWANGFSGTVDIQVTANGCNGPSAQVIRTVTVTPTVGTPTAITISAGTEPSCQLTNGTTTTTYATTATNNTGFN